jgi:hypothetical protein
MAKPAPIAVDAVLTQQAKRAAISLRMSSDFSTVLQYLEARLDMHRQQLVVLSPEQVPAAQGRARELVDLFEVLKPKDNP